MARQQRDVFKHLVISPGTHRLVKRRCRESGFKMFKCGDMAVAILLAPTESEAVKLWQTARAQLGAAA